MWESLVKIGVKAASSIFSGSSSRPSGGSFSGSSNQPVTAGFMAPVSSFLHNTNNKAPAASSAITARTTGLVQSDPLALTKKWAENLRD